MWNVPLRNVILMLVAGLTFLSMAPHSALGQKPKYAKITIHNDEPRQDVRGAIVDAHDGNLQFFNGRYYLYGTAYGGTAGFSINNRFRVYSSADLEHWVYEGELLKAPTDGVYYRPYVVYNATTKKYVLWYNWYPKLWNGQVGVATSESPVGPFTIVDPNVHLSQTADHPGDGSLFVDRDGTGYFVYTVIDQGHAIRVERLSSDYLSSTGETSAILAKGCEAPAMFRHDSDYYVLFDSACCFCAKGSGARVFKSSSPLGPYTQLENINRDAEKNPIIHGQQTFVASIPTVDGTSLMWMADRWSSRPDHIKGHDFQYWTPLHISADGSIAILTDTPDWSISIEVGTKASPRKKVYTWPQKVDPNPVMIDPCTKASLSPTEAGQILSTKSGLKVAPR
jgi:hypothetical protein